MKILQVPVWMSVSSVYKPLVTILGPKTARPTLAAARM